MADPRVRGFPRAALRRNVPRSTLTTRTRFPKDVMPAKAPLLGLLIPLVLLCGDLGAPYPAGEVAFDVVRRDHFDALAVDADRGAPSQSPLLVRVHVVGDAKDADIGVASAWLLEHANVKLVPDENGVPLYLTRGDLAATSGKATLGATLPNGMAVEVADPDVGACVLAHEMLHFLGLGHVHSERNIMYRHCTGSMLRHAQLDDAQRARLDAVESIRALTPRGMETWASRA